MTAKMKKIGRETEEDRMLNDLFVSPIRTSFLEVGEEKCVIPVYYEEFRQQVDELEVRDDDVWVTGLPKTGTTWLYEMARLISNNLDYESDFEYLPFFLDFSLIHDTKKIQADLGVDGNNIAKLAEQKSPRCIKTHLHWSMLPEQIRSGIKKPKIIHILRNPKDTCVSYYHNSQVMDGYVGDFDQFCRLFLAGRLNYGPFFATSLSYWREKQRPNLLLVHYKDLKKNLPGSIKTIAEFLGKSLTEAQITGFAERMSFNAMQKHEETNPLAEHIKSFYKFYNLIKVEHRFFRVGKEGGYKSAMSPELIDKFDAWTETNLSNTGLNLE